MALTIERCDQCRFAGDQYTTDTACSTLGVSAHRWRSMCEAVDPALLRRRPAPATWSIVEYVAHSRAITSAMGRLVSTMSKGDLPPLDIAQLQDAAADDPPTVLDFDEEVDGLFVECERLHRKALTLDDTDWRREVVVNGELRDAEDVLRHAVHDATHHLLDGGRVLQALGAGAPRQAGTVAGLFTSDGGVPKRAVPEAHVGWRGVAGDRQRDLKHHGRPIQALCLWSLEVIAGLRAEGHPIEPGFAGENITVAGVDWTSIRPGVRLAMGDVLAEISAYAEPCRHNAAWFSDRDFRRIDHDRHRGSSRAYASVLQTGVIRRGDTVIVEPD